MFKSMVFNLPEDAIRMEGYSSSFIDKEGNVYTRPEGKNFFRVKAPRRLIHSGVMGGVVEGKQYVVHRQLAQAFLSETREEGQDIVIHKDGNPYNNRLDNLKWARKGDQVRRSNLKRDSDRSNVEVIDSATGKVIDTCNTVKEAVIKYKINKNIISDILNNRVDSHKGYTFRYINPKYLIDVYECGTNRLLNTFRSYAETAKHYPHVPKTTIIASCKVQSDKRKGSTKSGLYFRKRVIDE